MNISLLKEIGLTDSEIEIFIELFNLGEAKAKDLAQRTKKHRSNIYDILYKLIKKGLVSSTTKNRVKYFYITNPYKLEEYLKKLEKEFKKKEKQLRRFIERLILTKPEIKEKQNIEVFEGIDGLRALYYRLISIAKPNDEVYIVGSVKKIFKILEYHILDISKKSARINIKGKMIASKMIFRRPIMKLIKHFVNLDIRFIRAEYLSPTSVIIFKNFVGFFNYIDKPLTILIDNDEIAKAYKIYFNKMWKIAK